MNGFTLESINKEGVVDLAKSFARAIFVVNGICVARVFGKHQFEDAGPRAMLVD